MLEQIIKLLGMNGIEVLDEDTQGKLDVIVGITEQRLKVKLGGVNEIPDALKYIITEVSVARFNRIGSEGVNSHTVQGESMSWSEKDFEPYEDEIQAWLDAQDDPSTTKGMVSFL